MSSETVFKICDNEYDVIKKGRAQAEQVVQFTKWIAKHAMPIVDKISSNQSEEDTLEGLGGTTWRGLFDGILTELNTDALLSLFVLVFGCSQKIADQCFDVGTLVAGITALWDNQPGIRNVVQRFFSTEQSSDNTVSLSIESEQPTDGQTTKS